MADETKQKVIDYIFDKENVPAEIMDEFSRWLLDHEDDVETESIMLKKWEEYSKTLFEENDLKGLANIRKNIRSKERKNSSKTILKCAGVFLCIAMTFSAGVASSWFSGISNKEITLVTSGDNIGEFTLPDGTKVWLNEHSRLTYPENFDARKRIVSLQGEGFFEVRKDSSRPFKVKMQNLGIEVLGTSFGASCYPDDDCEEIVLKTGSVAVSGETLPKDIVMNPGEMLVYSPFEGNVKISRTNVSERYRWYEKYLDFENAELGDILANIEHRYRVEVKAQTSVSMKKRLSLTIIHEPLETIMDVIAALLPIRYELHGDKLIIKDKYHNTTTGQ